MLKHKKLYKQFTWNKLNNTDREKSGTRETGKSGYSNMRWNSNILLAETKYDKYCASV